MTISAHHRPAKPRHGRAAALAASVLVLACVWLAYTAWRGPDRVLVIYVREENSMGLDMIPSPEDATRPSCLDLEGGRLVLPEGAPEISARTSVIVLWETYTTGVLTGARGYCLDGFPASVPPAAPAAGHEWAILAGQLDLDGDASGSGPVSVVRGELGLDGLVGDGQEWRVAAVGGPDGIELLLPDDPGYAPAIREAFYDQRPVSVFSVSNCGLWDIDRIETSGD